MLAIYCRLSKMDEDSTSIINQKREGEEFAKNNGFEDFKIYDEGEGVSGALDWTLRPQLYELIGDISDNKIEAVWFRNQNRLGRAMDTHVAFVKACLKNNTKVYFDDNEWDYTDATEDLVGNILSSLNTYTAKLQSQQTKKALLGNIKSGRAHSIIHYGYMTDKDGYLKVNPKESKIVKRMFTEHANGIGCTTIARRLTEEGVPTRYDTKKNGDKVKWSDKAVRSILRNTLCYGQRSWQGKLHDAPAIVSKELWDKSIKAFTTNVNTHSLKRTEHKYLLNGIIKCGVCGRRMLGKRRVSGKDNAYTCAGKRIIGADKCHNRSISIDALEEFVWNRFFVDKQFVKLVEQAVEKSKDESKHKKLLDNMKDIDTEIAELIKIRKKGVSMAMRGLVTEDDIADEIKSIDLQLNDLNIKNDKLVESLEFVLNAEKEFKTIKDRINNLKSDVPFKTKREIIHEYIDTIEIVSQGRDHFIWMSFHMDVEEESFMRLSGKFHVFNHNTAELEPFNEFSKLHKRF